jgi:hypothetical protein
MGLVSQAQHLVHKESPVWAFFFFPEVKEWKRQHVVC